MSAHPTTQFYKLLQKNYPEWELHTGSTAQSVRGKAIGQLMTTQLAGTTVKRPSFAIQSVSFHYTAVICSSE
jgi:hypothetical protein